MDSEPLRRQKPKSQLKFLTRNLKISYFTELGLLQVRIKRIYLKHLVDAREVEKRGRRSLEAAYSQLYSKKPFKTLKNLQIISTSRTQTYETFKVCKNLKNFQMDSFSQAINMQNLAFIIKRLPVSVQKISLDVSKEGRFNLQSIHAIAKSIRRLPNLQFFYRKFQLDPPSDVEKELRILNRSVCRLKKMKTAFFRSGYCEQPGFQKAMRKSSPLPGINGLEICLMTESFPSYERLRGFCGSEQMNFRGYIDLDSITEKQKDSYKQLLKHLEENNFSSIQIDPNEDPLRFNADLNFLNQCLVREEIKPFFRFDLFPNLKILKLSLSICDYALGSFARESFSSLKKLEELYIKIGDRPTGTVNIFKGLITLPPLKKFSLKTSFLKNEDWVQFTQFLRKQEKLECFSLKLESERENNSLQNLIECLKDKTLLSSLELKSADWSFYTLCEQLKLLDPKVKLHNLMLGASDEKIIDPKKSRNQIQDFRNFLKNQSNFLKNFQLSLKNFLEDTQIFSAIPYLPKLRNLKLVIKSSQSYTIYGRNERKEKISMKSPKNEYEKAEILLKTPSEWEFWFIHFLFRLENLESLYFKFDGDLFLNQDFGWLIKMLGALGKLKKLRKISRGPAWYGEEFENIKIAKKIASAVLQLRNIREIDLHDFYDIYGMNEDERHISVLGGTLKQVNKRQSTKCEYMF